MRQSSPDLKEVAVELTAFGNSGPKLVSFLVLKSSPANGDGIILDERVKSVIHAVKHRLERVLPHYIVPSVLLPIASLPLIASIGFTKKHNACYVVLLLSFNKKKAKGCCSPSTAKNKPSIFSLLGHFISSYIPDRRKYIYV